LGASENGTALEAILAVLREVNAGNLSVRASTDHADSQLNAVACELNRLVDNLEQKAAKSPKIEDFLQKVLHHISIDVAIFDKDFNFLFVNRHAIKDDKIRQWVIGKSEFDYCHYRGTDPRFAEKRYGTYRQAVELGRPVTFREDLPQPNGKFKSFLRTIGPLFDANGELEMMLGCGIEITSLVETEDALLLRNAELDKTYRELDHFVYRTSHEMRGPVASIFGLLNLADGAVQSPEMRYYLSMVRKSAIKLDTFIREVVDYSINSRHDLNMKAVDMDVIVQDVFEGLRFLDPHHEVKLEYECVAEVPLISDGERVRMLLTHLLSNSIKYRDPAKAPCWAAVRIQVSKGTVEIVVADNGKGISKQHQPRLFEMFVRGTHDAFGSGLGLYIVAEVLGKLGGQILVESELGKGSVFKILLHN
jgi:signal transduction histidine kinase